MSKRGRGGAAGAKFRISLACPVGEMGRVYPPEDIWREPDLGSRKVSKSNKARRSSLTSKKKGLKKADSARRLKVPRNSQSGLAEEDKSGEEEAEAKHGRSKEKKTLKSSAHAKSKGRKK